MRDPEIRSLTDLAHRELAEKWQALLGEPPPRRTSAAFMRRILAFEIQARQSGGIAPITRKKLEKVSRTGDADSSHLEVGARLIREWNGETHVVEVVTDGFVWREQRFRSLSAVAKAITGAHWSGPRFFGLKGRSA